MPKMFWKIFFYKFIKEKFINGKNKTQKPKMYRKIFFCKFMKEKLIKKKNKV